MTVEQLIEKILKFPGLQLETFKDDSDDYYYVTINHRESLKTVTWDYGFTLQGALANVLRNLNRIEKET